MNRVRAVDPANATLTVEAGVPLADGPAGRRGRTASCSRCRSPRRAAARSAATCRPTPAAPRCCASATRASSSSASKSCSPTAAIWDGLRGLRKDNTGYDLKQLFIGAEGTLGIVTAAVLKLFPAPADARDGARRAARRRARRSACSRDLRQALGDRLTGFELMSALFARAVAQASSGAARPAARASRGTCWCRSTTARAIRRVAGAARARARRGARIAASCADATIAQSGEQARALWALRENIAEAQRREGPNIKHDISLPVSAIPRFLDEARAALDGGAARRALRRPSATWATATCTTTSPRRRASRRARSWRTRARANRIVHDLVAAHGGSISAEHGIGQQKRDELVRYKSAVELDLMRTVKAALDPAGIFNPGKIF